MEGEDKSSRAKADLFELLITQKLIKNYNLQKDYSTEINNLKDQLMEFIDGNLRINEQEERSNIGVKKIIEILDREISNHGKIKFIDWIGRLHQTKNTLSDVDIVFEDKIKLGISLKSVRTGTGTQKNLGLDTVKNYLSIDVDADIDEMWQKVRNELRRKGLEEIAELPRTEIKNRKYKHPKIKEIGKRFGLPVQKKAVEQSVINFNTLSDKKKSDFLKCIFGIEEDKKLLNVVVQDENIAVYWNDKYNAVIEGKTLIAKNIQDKSYGIYFDDELILRVQTSFTNGVGISAFCQRAFLINLET